MDVRFEIQRRIGKFGTKGNWNRELNVVAWNGNSAKYDIREWDETHERMSRGITLTAEEAIALYGLLKEEFDK